jgi:putative transposase
MEHEIHIVSGKVAADHVHMFVSYRPQMAVTKMVQYLKGASSRILLQEFAQLRKQFWGRHLWARGYMAISSGNITDEMIQKYIEEQEGEIVDDGRFQIDSSL